MKRIVTLLILIFIVIAAVPVGAAQADTLMDRTIKADEVVSGDVSVFGGNLVIEKGAIIKGDVLVSGGHAEIHGDVTGDVAIFGGDVEFDGVVEGDLVIFGGNLDVSTLAEVDGDCALFGGTVKGDGASNIGCTAVGEDFPFAIGDFIGARPVPPVPPIPQLHDDNFTTRSRGIGGFFRDIGEAFGSSLMLGLLALIVAAMLPNQLNQVSDVIVRKPVASGTVGVLTAMAGPFAIAIMVLVSSVLIILCGLGLLGFPVVFLMSVALGFGFLMGWVAIGTLLGKRLAESMNLSNQSLPVVAALGTGLLTLVIGVMTAMPFGGEFFGTLMAIFVGSAGLGAVALTKFGTRNYPLGMSNEEKVAAVLETLPVEDAEAA